MPTDLTCPECDARVPAADRGGRVRCPDCGARVPVPGRSRRRAADDEEPVRRPRRRRDDDEEDEGDTRGGGSPVLGWAIGGGVLAVLVVVGVVVGLRGRKPDPAPVARPDPNPGRPVPPPNVKFDNPNPKPPVTPPVAPPKPADPPPPVWTAAPDPAPDGGRAANPKALRMPLGRDAKVYFPSAPSPFAVVSAAGPKGDGAHAVDLRTGHPAGVVCAPVPQYNRAAVSPDGEFLAGAVWGNDKQVDVWSLRTGAKTVLEVRRADRIDFAGPGQLVAITPDKVGQKAEVWDVREGKRVREVPLGHADRPAAVSPGGRYLARFGGGVFRLHDLDGGPASELSAPESGSGCDGLAFSDDGTLLAGCFGSRIVVVDVAAGRVAVQHAYAQDVSGMTGAIGRPGIDPLQWLPDGGGWVAYGDTVVGRDSGRAGVKLTAVVKGLQTDRPLRVLGKGYLAAVVGEGKDRVFTTVGVDSSLLTVPGGPLVAGGAIDKPGDWSGVDRLTAGGAVAWAARADPAPAARGKPADAIPVGASGAVRAAFAPAAGQAVVVTEGGGKTGFEPQTWNAQRYDLASGRAVGPRVAVGPGRAAGVHGPGPLAAVSPDAARLALQAPPPPPGVKDDPTVDVWALGEARPLLRLKVGDGKDGAGRVSWLGFVQADRLWTRSAAGTLALWAVPDGKALVALDGAGTPALSPGGRYLAAPVAAGVEVLDARTGARVGRLAAPAGTAGGRAAAFRADGEEVAAALTDGKGGVRLRVARWRLADGAPAGDVPVAAHLGAGLAYAGPDQFLLNGTDLLDPATRTVYHRYPAGFAEGSPDGRHWFVSGPPEGRVLGARTLPDDTARQTLASLKGAATVLGPGTAVAVRVDAAGGVPNLEVYRKRMADAAGRRLEANGQAEGAGGLTLAVGVQESDTGKTISLETLFGGPGRPGGGPVTVPVRRLTFTATLTDAQGTVLWSAKGGNETFFGYVRQFSEDPAAALLKELWESSVGWAGGLNLPTHIVRAGGQVVTLPVSGPLAPGP
jgi:DNA-directed RNA polymerase subunit RPC12/RpoP